MEYTKTYAKALFNARKDIIGPEATQIAINGMSQKLDSNYAGALLVNFLLQYSNLSPKNHNHNQ